jgi:hypothetical protein
MDTHHTYIYIYTGGGDRPRDPVAVMVEKKIISSNGMIRNERKEANSHDPEEGLDSHTKKKLKNRRSTTL